MMAVGLAALVAAGLVSVHRHGHVAVDRERAAWRSIGRDLAAHRQSLTPREANPSALRLEDLAAEVGIHVAPRSRISAAGASTPSAFRGGARRLSEVIASDDPSLPEAPEALLRHLQAHEAQWRDLRRHLAESDAPEWERDAFARTPPIPNLLGILDLATTLHLDAAHALREGRPADADQALEASWRLSQALRASRHPIVHDFDLAITEQRRAVLGRADLATLERWRERLAGSRSLAEFVGAFQWEAAWWDEMLVGNELIRADLATNTPHTLTQRLDAHILAPHAVAVRLSSLRRAVHAIDRARGDLPLTELQALDHATDESWNPLVERYFLPVARLAARSWLADLQAELMIRAIQAREAGGAVDAAWSRSRFGGVSYRLERRDDETLRVEAVGDPIGRALAAANREGAHATAIVIDLDG